MKNKYFWLLVSLVLALNLINSRQPTLAQESVQITAEVLYNNLNVRSQPNTRAEIFGQLDMGAIVNVTSREDRHIDGRWVYVVESSTQLIGWVNIEYIVFSRGDWADFVPVLSPEEILYSNGPEVPLQAKVVYSNVNVHPEASYRSEIIGILSLGSPVEIIGRQLYIRQVYLTSPPYVYVEQIDGDIAGWVDYGYLQLADGTPIWSILWKLPVIEVLQTPRNVVQVEGQIIGVVYLERGLHLRTEPNTDSEVLMTIQHKSVVAVYGSTNSNYFSYDTWVYIKVLETGQTGWALAWPIHYPYRFDKNTLPILAPTSTPELPLSAQSNNALAGITNRRTPLRLTPYILGDSNEIAQLPPNTPITVIGRNFTMDWFKVVADGQEGWVRFSYITVEGDALRLPITLLDGGYRVGYFD